LRPPQASEQRDAPSPLPLFQRKMQGKTSLSQRPQPERVQEVIEMNAYSGNSATLPNSGI
jgi:hypothetical protein